MQEVFVWSGAGLIWAVLGMLQSHHYPISVLLGYSNTWNFTQFLALAPETVDLW